MPIVIRNYPEHAVREILDQGFHKRNMNSFHCFSVQHVLRLCRVSTTDGNAAESSLC